MPSDQHPSAPPSHLPLDILLAVDVDVGWQVGLTVLPGQVTPSDALPLSSPDGVTAAFDAEYTALISNPDGVRELRDVVINAIASHQADIGTEFYIQNFGSAFYRVVACTECFEALECPRCNKAGCVTEIFRPYLIGLCSVKGVHEPASPHPGALMAEPLAQAAAGVAANRPLLAPPEPRPTRHWLWTVPLAALATVVMAISIGLRSKYESTPAKLQPEPPALVSIATVPPDALGEPAQPGAATESAPRSAASSQLSGPSEPLPLAPDHADAALVEPVRKPAPPTPSAPPAAAPAPASPAQVEKSSPVARMQSALMQLNFYQGPVNGVLDVPTRQALTAFLALVPAPVRAQYGIRMAALTEAAVRHEFALKSK